jgi:hypothetical protein
MTALLVTPSAKRRPPRHQTGPEVPHRDADCSHLQRRDPLEAEEQLRVFIQDWRDKQPKLVA